MAMTTHAGAGGAGGERFWAAAMLIAFGLLCAGLGTAVLAKVAWNQLSTHMAARDWPVAPAIVQRVSLTEMAGAGARGPGAIWRLELAVAYDYTVNGTLHHGERATLADIGDLDDRRLKSIYGRLKFAQVTGRPVNAAYDPRDPARAYLDTGFPWHPALFHGGLGLAFSLVGLAFLAAAFRTPRKGR